MRLLANENFPLKSVIYLKEKGYDVKAIGIDNSGIMDEEVMDIAIREERLILTFDRDYGELIFRHNYRPQKGVIYLRIKEFLPEQPGQLIEKLLSNAQLNFDGSLTVVDLNGIRQRKY
jgi:predicted nuclease of predicted toxin-antitoxin system